MSHAEDRKQRKEKRKHWKHRGGKGMVQASATSSRGESGVAGERRKRRPRGGRTEGGKGVLMRASGFWAMVMGVTTIAIVVAAVTIILMGIFG